MKILILGNISIQIFFVSSRNSEKNLSYVEIQTVKNHMTSFVYSLKAEKLLDGLEQDQKAQGKGKTPLARLCK